VRLVLALAPLLVTSLAATGRALAEEPPPPTKVPAAVEAPISARPPPLHVEYAQYGVALAAEIKLDAGAACQAQSGSSTIAPCILGSGGGLVLRGGYRSPGPWYVGGAYEFVKMDSGNLYRLGVFQQIRAEMRYLPDTGYRASPYVSWGAGAIAYGNEWGIETGGALVFGGAGVEIEVSRKAVLGLALVYRPALIAGWTDTAGHVRETALAQFLGFELVLEVRSELGRQ
jgi:hypothetical protein